MLENAARGPSRNAYSGIHRILRLARIGRNRRADGEYEQAAVRVSLGVIAWVYMGTFVYPEQAVETAWPYWINVLGVSYVAISLAILLSIHGWTASSPPRRITALVIDTCAISFCLCSGNELTAPLAAAYLWMTIGNGLRFGHRYVYLAALLSISGFGFVYSVSPFWRSHGAFSATIVLMLLVVPAYLALLLQRLQSAIGQLSWQATHDALTGLYNRREFERRLQALLAPQDRLDAREHVVMFIDLDGFKSVNDTYGHATGDQVLRQISGLLGGQLREGDTLARLGGDEFAAIAVDATLQGGREIAERIRQAVKRCRSTADGASFRLGASVGIVHVSEGQGHDLRALMNSADSACYEAKRGGRDRVEVAKPNALPGFLSHAIDPVRQATT